MSNFETNLLEFGQKIKKVLKWTITNDICEQN